MEVSRLHDVGIILLRNLEVQVGSVAGVVNATFAPFELAQLSVLLRVDPHKTRFINAIPHDKLLCRALTAYPRTLRRSEISATALPPAVACHTSSYVSHVIAWARYVCVAHR